MNMELMIWLEMVKGERLHQYFELISQCNINMIIDRLIDPVIVFMILPRGISAIKITHCLSLPPLQSYNTTVILSINV